MTRLSAYLLFDGTCSEALAFYHSVFGGTITDPLQQQPFGYYGALNDQFGVRWMFHTDRK